MTPVETFLICLGVGAALIAFWLVLRFPERAPGDFKRAFLHVGLAMLAGWLASNLFDALVAYGFAAAVAGGFFVVFSVRFFSFLFGGWVLKISPDMLCQYRR